MLWMLTTGSDIFGHAPHALLLAIPWQRDSQFRMVIRVRICNNRHPSYDEGTTKLPSTRIGRHAPTQHPVSRRYGVLRYRLLAASAMRPAPASWELHHAACMHLATYKSHLQLQAAFRLLTYGETMSTPKRLPVPPAPCHMPWPPIQ